MKICDASGCSRVFGGLSGWQMYRSAGKDYCYEHIAEAKIPPLTKDEIDEERALVAGGVEYELSYPIAYAYCHAQALADKDGLRRRVFWDDGMFRIELAHEGRGNGR